MNHFDVVGFSKCHSEEVMFLLTLSVLGLYYYGYFEKMVIIPSKPVSVFTTGSDFNAYTYHIYLFHMFISYMKLCLKEGVGICILKSRMDIS